MSINEKNWGVESAFLPEGFHEAVSKVENEKAAMAKVETTRVERPLEVQEEYDMT